MRGLEPPCTGEKVFACWQQHLPEEAEQPWLAAGTDIRLLIFS